MLFDERKNLNTKREQTNFSLSLTVWSDGEPNSFVLFTRRCLAIGREK